MLIQQRLDGPDAAFVASDVAIDIDNFLSRGDKRLKRVKELAAMIRDTKADAEIDILKEAISRSYDPKVRLVEVRSRGQEIAAKLECIPNISRQDAEKLGALCIELSQAIMVYRAGHYPTRNYLSAA